MLSLDVLGGYVAWQLITEAGTPVDDEQRGQPFSHSLFLEAAGRSSLFYII
jgi:hypothetical protein